MRAPLGVAMIVGMTSFWLLGLMWPAVCVRVVVLVMTAPRLLGGSCSAATLVASGPPWRDEKRRP